MNDIGQKFRLIREFYHLSQDEVAEMMAMTQPTYSRLERHGNDVRYGEIERFAKVFKMRVREVEEFEGEGCLNR